ncbi:MAG: rod shape-determining protein MreC [Acidimicrobiales bacterium]
MAKPRRSRRPRTTLILLVLASVIIITLDARGGLDRVTSGVKSVATDAFSPVRSAVDDVVEPIGSFLAGSVHYGAVRQQNQKLQNEINQLKSEDQQAQQMEQQLQQITSLLHLSFIGNLTTVPAEVIDYNSSNFAATIQISVGRDDGVQLNMPVVTGGGLVGQVVQVAHHSATVRLITDGASTVGVLYGTPGLFAAANGQGAGKLLSVDLVPSGTPLSPGELFTTSGLNGAAFPASIPVGYVVEAKTGLTASQETVTLRPSVDLTRLRYVSVVLWGPSSS